MPGVQAAVCLGCRQEFACCPSSFGPANSSVRSHRSRDAAKKEQDCRAAGHLQERGSGGGGGAALGRGLRQDEPQAAAFLPQLRCQLHSQRVQQLGLLSCRCLKQSLRGPYRVAPEEWRCFTRT